MATVTAATSIALGQTAKCAELSANKDPFFGSLRLVQNGDAPSPLSLSGSGPDAPSTFGLAGYGDDCTPTLQRRRRIGHKVYGGDYGGMGAALICWNCKAAGAAAAGERSRHGKKLSSMRHSLRQSTMVTRAYDGGEGPSEEETPKGFGPTPKLRSPKGDGKTAAGGGGGGGRGQSYGGRTVEKTGYGGYEGYISDDDDDDEDMIPEAINQRMMNRVGVIVGVPVLLGFAFFPFYYYLKVVRQLDVPYWLPFITSIFTFSSAGLGISYGILSTSWDPNREGTLLGFKEIQANLPVFIQSFKPKKKKSQ